MTEIAWSAGFFDGEGSVYARSGENRRGLVLSVTQNRREPLDRFKAAVGATANVNGPYRNRTGSPWYRLTAYEREADVIIALLWPWLSEPKREQIARIRASTRRSADLIRAPGAIYQDRDAVNAQRRRRYAQRKRVV